MINILAWNGRLGNNILQILRAIYLAENWGHEEVRLPHHPILKMRSIIIALTSAPAINDVSGIFFDLKNFDLNTPNTSELQHIARKYKAQIFRDVLRELNINLEQKSQSIVYAHIRGGDVFGWRVHPSYLQPPLWYYNFIIDRYDKCKLIKEDKKNPVVKKLKSNPKIEDISSTELEDFTLLATSKNLIFSASTFCYSAFLFNENVKTIYIPQYFYNELPSGDWPDNLDIIIIELPDYIKNGTWRNSFFQRKKMVNYKAQ